MTGTTVRSSLAGTAVALRGARGASRVAKHRTSSRAHLTRRRALLLTGAATRTATSLQLEPSGHTYEVDRVFGRAPQPPAPRPALASSWFCPELRRNCRSN